MNNKGLKYTIGAVRHILLATSLIRDGFNNNVMTPITGMKYFSVTPYLQGKKAKKSKK